MTCYLKILKSKSERNIHILQGRCMSLTDFTRSKMNIIIFHSCVHNTAASAQLWQVKRNDKLMSKRRLIWLEPSLTVKARWQAEVTQIDLATVFAVGQWQCHGQAPLSHNADVATGRIHAHYRSLVGIGPLNHRRVPWLVWRSNITTIQRRDNYINCTGRQTCIQS